MPGTHAKLSPSSASSWMNCPGFPDANEGLPDEDSDFAFEGTVAHWVLEMCLLFGHDSFDFVGMTTRNPDTGTVFEWTEEDAELSQPGVDWINEQPGVVYAEARVDLSHWLGDNQFGTCDVTIVSRERVVIVDRKWGRGIPVSPVKNKQLQLYALGAIRKFAPEITDPAFPIHIVIEQPRNSAGGGEWVTTLGDLFAFGEEARAAAEATRQPNPPRIASAEACLWCRRRQQEPSEPGAVSGCKTYDEFNLAMIQAEFDDLDGDDLVLPDADTLSIARRAFIHRHKSMIEKWLDGISASVMDRALVTGEAGGLKAVAGKPGRRVWVDPKAAEKAVVGLLGDRSFTKKLITPTQVGKQVSKEDYEKVVDQHVTRADPKPILVPLEDERPALLVADEFDSFE